MCGPKIDLDFREEKITNIPLQTGGKKAGKSSTEKCRLERPKKVSYQEGNDPWIKPPSLKLTFLAPQWVAKGD